MAEPSATAGRDWSYYVEQSLRTLIERGQDRYGPVHSPMLMAVIDLNTLDSPAEPKVFDSLIWLETRIHRRGEQGSNLWQDQPTLRTMYQLSKLTNNPKYAQAADDYAKFALENCRNEKGLLLWGSHVHWNCYKERAAGDEDGHGPHEILIHRANWPEMYRLNPQAVREETDAIWEWHVHDKATGHHNRHDDKSVGREFSFSGSSFISTFAFMYQATGEKHYLDKARLIANWHYRHRNKDTNLPPELPGLADDDTALYGRVFMTPLTGPHSAALLHAYETTNDRYFFDVAADYLIAYDTYGWHEPSKSYVGMLNLDGGQATIDDVPPGMRSQVVGYDASEPDPEYSVPPVGPLNAWQSTIFPLEFPLASAESAIYAYEIATRDQLPGADRFLASAERWAMMIKKQLPPQPGMVFRESLRRVFPDLNADSGTYAVSYGRAISFYVHLYRATNDQQYLNLAEQIAEAAVDKLYVETSLTDADGASKTYGLFKGHPCKPYYEAVDGVGLLLFGLLELDHPDSDLGWAF